MHKKKHKKTKEKYKSRYDVYVEEMRKLAGMLMCSRLLIAFSCGEAGDPQAETKRQARQLAGAPEMQTFLAGAKSKLVSAMGGNVIAESAVKVAAGLKGGKSTADFICGCK